MKVYQKLARTLDAYNNCVEKGNEEWTDKHMDTINRIVENQLPSGSGIDSGCTIEHKRSKHLLIYSSYHVMNENGMYNGWIDFTVKVNPSLMFGFDLLITGNFGKHQDIKEYLYDLFGVALGQEID